MGRPCLKVISAQVEDSGFPSLGPQGLSALLGATISALQPVFGHYPTLDVVSSGKLASKLPP